MAQFAEVGEGIRDKFLEFLEDFEEPRDSSQDAEPPRRYYHEQLQSMRNADKTTMYVDFDHVLAYDAELADIIQVTSS